MKTTKFFSVLSLALIFVGVTSGFSKNNESLRSNTLKSTGIIYQVIVHSDFIKNPCNTYLVQILDANGLLVAPAQVFVPGINKYYFKENASFVGVMHSIRAARLVPVEDPKFLNCAFPLVTVPDVKRGAFWAGHTYIFNLYPKIQSYITD